MILSAPEIAKRLRTGRDSLGDDPSSCLVITPSPDMAVLDSGAGASVDLRLGTWFVSPRFSHLRAYDTQSNSENASESVLGDRRYVRFGNHFVLHPRRFVLAATLEWVRLPSNLCGYITGKSSWGRHGLVIETAPGVHPGFTGCLTLELANVGEVPIILQPGLLICQLFLHIVTGDTRTTPSKLAGSRLPRLLPVRPDDFATRLNQLQPNSVRQEQ